MRKVFLTEIGKNPSRVKDKKGTSCEKYKIAFLLVGEVGCAKQHRVEQLQAGVHGGAGFRSMRPPLQAPARSPCHACLAAYPLDGQQRG